MGTMSTTSIVFSSIIFMLLSTTIIPQASGSRSAKPKAINLMVEACKNASIHHFANTVPQEFCLSTLQSDNRSTEAKDLHDLVFIAMDITKGHVTAASDMVRKMLQNAKKGTEMMRVLTFCGVYYEELAGMLNVCDAMIKNYPGYKGEMRSHELALCVSRTSYPVSYCGHELDDMPKEVALIKENAELEMLVDMSANFLVPLALREDMLFGH